MKVAGANLRLLFHLIALLYFHESISYQKTRNRKERKENDNYLYNFSFKYFFLAVKSLPNTS